MNELMALELEFARRDEPHRDFLMLDWLGRLPDRFDGGPQEMWRRHSYGLAGNLTNALALMRDLFGDAAWSIESVQKDGKTVHVARVTPPDAESTQTGEASHEAGALCAAIVRAEAAMEGQRARAARLAEVAA